MTDNRWRIVLFTVLLASGGCSYSQGKANSTIDQPRLTELGIPHPTSIGEIADKLPGEERGAIHEIYLVEGRSVASLAGIEKLPGLRKLGIVYSSITSLEGIKSATIEDLSLLESKLETLTGLENLPHLTRVNFSGSPVKDISSLKLLPALKEVGLSATQIRILDIAAIPPSVRSLDLRDLNIRSLEDLKPLFAFLETIDLEDNLIAQLPKKPFWGNLKVVYLARNPLVATYKNQQGEFPSSVLIGSVRIWLINPDL